MKIVVIYGTMRKAKSTTYNIAQQFIKVLNDGDSINEFYLPQSSSNFCRGCWKCFEDYSRCPDFEDLKPIIDQMLIAELIIITAPVYVFHIPGQVKTFLDHFGYQWMAHQPRKEMFKKQALLISTAAGSGTKSALKDLKDSMKYWGIARTYEFGENTYAKDWDSIGDKRQEYFGKVISRLVKRIKRDRRNLRPCLSVKLIFYMMRFIHKKFKFSESDVKHWQLNGWLDKIRPWNEDD